MAIQEANEEVKEFDTETDEGNNQDTSDELTESEDDTTYQSEENDEYQGFSFLYNDVVKTKQA